jgi:hypothetical protein
MKEKESEILRKKMEEIQRQLNSAIAVESANEQNALEAMASKENEILNTRAYFALSESGFSDSEIESLLAAKKMVSKVTKPAKPKKPGRPKKAHHYYQKVARKTAKYESPRAFGTTLQAVLACSREIGLDPKIMNKWSRDTMLAKETVSSACAKFGMPKHAGKLAKLRPNALLFLRKYKTAILDGSFVL